MATLNYYNLNKANNNLYTKNLAFNGTCKRLTNQLSQQLIATKKYKTYQNKKLDIYIQKKTH